MNSRKLNRIIWAAMLAILVQAAESGGPLDTWHARNSPSDTTPLFSVVYGKGLFVAVGQGGTILTSSDGTAWSHQNSGTTDDLGPLVFGSGIFLVRGAYNMLKSPDGTNWTSSAWVADEPIEGLDFANDRFFVLSHDLRVNGDHVIIFTSTDAINWARFDTRQSGLPGAVTHANGLYVEVGSGKATGHTGYIPLVMTSPDAISWKGLYFDSPLYWDMFFTDVAFGRGMFVATVGIAGGGGAIASSVDGTNWVFSATGLIAMHEVMFADGIFVAVGSVGMLVTSSDGLHWTVRDPGTKFFLTGPAYGQNTFVAVGGQGIIIQSDPIVTLGWMRGTSTEVSLTGPPGRTCEIQAADQLLATNNWLTLGTVTLTNSATSWVDVESTNRPQRFYRAVLQQ
jgi:hypothetical protein